MSRLLVTGGAGFIGSNLALQLEADGHEVVVLDNFRTGSRENLVDFRGEIREGDITTGAGLGSERWDGIFHHGDITDPRHGDEEEVWRKNLGGFSQVLELCRQQRIRLVYASTAGLYGNGPTPMREDQPKQVLTAYGRSKLAMDELAARHGAEIPIVGLRYFNVFGPREARKGRAASMVYHLAQQVKVGKTLRLFKYGEQRRDFIYVKDVVAANLCAMRAPSGVYNVGTGIASTFNEVAEAVCNAFHVRPAIEYFDMPYEAATYQSNTQADTILARDRLGFTAQWGLWRGVEDYVDWMRGHL
jgi:ADP-L-glycero-D-manno-heptose 6-epimerase